MVTITLIHHLSMHYQEGSLGVVILKSLKGGEHLMKSYSNSLYQGIPNFVACNIYMVWTNRWSLINESCHENIIFIQSCITKSINITPEFICIYEIDKYFILCVTIFLNINWRKNFKHEARLIKIEKLFLDILRNANH